MKRLFLILITIVSLTCFAPSHHRRSKSIAPTQVPANTPVDSPTTIPQSHSSISLNSHTSADSEKLTKELEKIQAGHTLARIGELQAKTREKDTTSQGNNSFVTISFSSRSLTPCVTPDHIKEYINTQEEELTVRLQGNKTPTSDDSTTTEPLSPEQEEELLKTLAIHGRTLKESHVTDISSTSIHKLLAARSRNKSPIPIREEVRNFSADS